MTDQGDDGEAGAPTSGAADADAGAGAGRSTAGKTLEAWAFVRQMLDDMTAMVEADAETELELLEGLRVLGRVTALCSELSLDVDPERPWFFSMNTDAPADRRPQPGRQVLPRDDRRRRIATASAAAAARRLLPRLPGARGHRAHAAPHGRVRRPTPT